MVDAIKILIYKESQYILEKIDLDDKEIFLEPLIFAYFNGKKDNSFPQKILEELLQGYYQEKEKLKLNFSFNNNEIAYLPNLGYFKSGQQIPFSQIEMIKGTSVEILKYSHPLIDVVFKSVSENDFVDNDLIINEQLYNENIGYLTNAFQYIKASSKAHFELIEKHCKKCLLFKTDPKNTNSFATINAHGMAFFNVYQDDYDEVFFVDDIAHQTGHIILTSMLFERKKLFLVDENKNIGAITKKPSEYRSFYTLFHALFTYYTSLLCLNNCIEHECFDDRQMHEAKGRIGFYLRKLISDLDNFNKVVEHYNGIEKVLTIEGIEIYDVMNATFEDMINKWYDLSNKFEYHNQPYNFTYKEFIKLNPTDSD